MRNVLIFVALIQFKSCPSKRESEKALKETQVAQRHIKDFLVYFYTAKRNE